MKISKLKINSKYSSLVVNVFYFLVAPFVGIWIDGIIFHARHIRGTDGLRRQSDGSRSFGETLREGGFHAKADGMSPFPILVPIETP